MLRLVDNFISLFTREPTSSASTNIPTYCRIKILNGEQINALCSLKGQY